MDHESRLVVPFECAFSENVNVGDGENCGESGHAPKYGVAVLEQLFEDDGPRIHKHDFDVEQHEKHGHEVEFDAEAGLCFTDRQHTALVSRVFICIRSGGFSKQVAHNQHAARQADGRSGLH